MGKKIGLAAIAAMGAMAAGALVPVDRVDRADRASAQVVQQAERTAPASSDRAGAWTLKNLFRGAAPIRRMYRPTYIVKGKPGAAQLKRAARKRRNIRARLPKH